MSPQDVKKNVLYTFFNNLHTKSIGTLKCDEINKLIFLSFQVSKDCWKGGPQRGSAQGRVKILSDGWANFEKTYDLTI